MDVFSSLQDLERRAQAAPYQVWNRPGLGGLARSTVAIYLNKQPKFAPFEREAILAQFFGFHAKHHLNFLDLRKVLMMWLAPFRQDLWISKNSSLYQMISFEFYRLFYVSLILYFVFVTGRCVVSRHLPVGWGRKPFRYWSSLGRYGSGLHYSRYKDEWM